MKTNKITKDQYNQLKKSYLNRNRCMYSLYKDFNKEINISKQVFFRLINMIREEEGLKNFYYVKK